MVFALYVFATDCQPRSQGPFSTSRGRERTLGTRLTACSAIVVSSIANCFIIFNSSFIRRTICQETGKEILAFTSESPATRQETKTWYRHPWK